MYLIIIIPCLNEEQSIGKVISNLPENIDGITDFDILVVDDGSTDKSVEIARKYGAKVVSHSRNMGVGAAFHTGISEALQLGADIILNMDADGQFNSDYIPVLLQPILDGKADFVTASRFKDKSLIPEMPFMKKWGNMQIARVVSFLVGEKFYDVACGFRAYSRETALRMNLFGKFTYTQETFLDLAFKNLRIIEVPVKVRGVREFGKSRVASNLWVYAINTSKIIFRTFRDYKPFKFFSSLALITFILALGLGTFLGIHYLQTGDFKPHLWAGFSAGFLLGISIVLLITGLLADMLDRIRKNQERLLYFEKEKRLKK